MSSVLGFTLQAVFVEINIAKTDLCYWFGVHGMADTRLTKIGPLRALQLCAFGAFAPKRLIEAELSDEEVRRGSSQPSSPEEHSAFKLRSGVWASLLWVICSIVVGYIGGRLLGAVSGQATGVLTRGLQALARRFSFGQRCSYEAGTFRPLAV